MADDFLANVQQEDAVILTESPARTDGQVTETPAVTPADETTKVDKPSQGGVNTPDANIPFHKHPRWQAAQEELKRLREYESSSKTKLETYEQVMSKFNQPTQNQVSIPEWFPKSGNQKADEQKYQEYLNYENGVKAQIKQELVEEQTKEAQAKVAEEKKWSDWVENGLNNLEDKYGKIDRNRIQKVALDYLPTDMEGNIDFEKAYLLDKQLNAQNVAVAEVKSDARKRLADTAGASGNRAEKAPQKFQTAQSLRNQSWDKLIE